MSDQYVRRVIRMFPDYGHRWPLWENTTAQGQTKYTMEPSDFGLSESLTLRLRTWYDAWDAENLDDSEWSSPENEIAWNIEGVSIAEQLREEVKAFADVEYDV
ncbi:hypothetical protein [Arthrobacter sp. HLT1-20]